VLHRRGSMFWTNGVLRLCLGCRQIKRAANGGARRGEAVHGRQSALYTETCGVPIFRSLLIPHRGLKYICSCLVKAFRSHKSNSLRGWLAEASQGLRKQIALVTSTPLTMCLLAINSRLEPATTSSIHEVRGFEVMFLNRDILKMYLAYSRACCARSFALDSYPIPP